ncbi:hypothetical protein ANCDUO_26965 [Ancylostoma duodenale]|uniref:Maestro-like HEAT-repeats domain-containing protein n=1 Tax=Ancylostoma duodenale TaxID=51022 RepID=A0A0C2FDB4_9BILA|nr:hypothetical protein ANCDUO_26965 [Ancylostoma duodenale]
MLQPYYGKLAEHERSRSVDATVQVLRVYLDKAEDITIGIASDFGPLSSLLARLSPRLVDSLALVRHQSLAAIHYAFRLANAYKGHGTHTDSSLFRIDEFARTYLNNEGRLDANDAKKAVRKMAEVSTFSFILSITIQTSNSGDRSAFASVPDADLSVSFV